MIQENFQRSKKTWIYLQTESTHGIRRMGEREGHLSLHIKPCLSCWLSRRACSAPRRPTRPRAPSAGLAEICDHGVPAGISWPAVPTHRAEQSLLQVPSSAKDGLFASFLSLLLLYNFQDEEGCCEITILKLNSVGYFSVYISQGEVFITENSSYNFMNPSKWVLKTSNTMIKAVRSSLMSCLLLSILAIGLSVWPLVAPSLEGTPRSTFRTRPSASPPTPWTPGPWKHEVAHAMPSGH